MYTRFGHFLFDLGPDLPKPMFGHCMVVVNETSLFVFDPSHHIENGSQTFLYDFDLNSWFKVWI